MKKIRKLFIGLSVIASAIAMVYACNTIYFRSAYTNHMQFLHSTKYLNQQLFLKAHMRNGDVWVFETHWKTDPGQVHVVGYGTLYDFNRNRIDSGIAKILIDSVAVFETNDKLDDVDKSRVTALTVITGINVGLTTICLVNPKACFGSCPTFYMGKERYVHHALAEGFSSAISPRLEYGDIDALGKHHAEGNHLDITMKNEALETHCVRDVQLLAFPVKVREHIYHDGSNTYYRCSNTLSPNRATAPEGEVTTLLEKDDKQERFSSADQNQLITRESIDLVFDSKSSEKQLGLVIDFRQTLMTTYFIYSAMGYMGDEVGDYFAKLETDPATHEQLKNGVYRELGKIDVLQWDDKKREWIPCGGLYETGPIAINRQILPLKYRSNREPQRIRLVMNKGLWRIDRTLLTEIDGTVEPLKLPLQQVLRKGKPDDSALARMRDSTQLLISMPGTAVQLRFEVPEKGSEYEIFLYAKGYYMEWMREEWLKHKDLSLLRSMIQQPRTYLNGQTAAYKSYEKTMEEVFWNSRIETDQTLNDER
jgi:hypothetical protein